MSFEFWAIMVWLVVIGGCLEILLHFWIKFVRRHFQWLITNKDETPILSEDGLKKFIPLGYDPELGWTRKPNTEGQEKGKFGTITWKINEKGARTNPGFENLQSIISCYGDSFTFSRQVNNDETWEHHLSKLQNSNVMNFGVGNHGIDQSLLRMKNLFPRNKTDIVILAVVPETISRILSYWKHYYEYGNTFAFKPRFVLRDDILHLLKNKIDNEKKFRNYEVYLEEIKENDFFYERKFRKEKLHFPYIITVLRNSQRNISIIFWITLIKLLRKINYDTAKIDWNSMKIIMKVNLQWRIRLFKSDDATSLLKKLIESFVDYAKENKFIPVFIFLPQKDDIHFIRKHYHFYEKFEKQIYNMKELHTVNVTKFFQNYYDVDKLYSDDNEYGGHFSKFGNQKVAELINDELIRQDLIKKI